MNTNEQWMKVISDNIITAQGQGMRKLDRTAEPLRVALMVLVGRFEKHMGMKMNRPQRLMMFSNLLKRNISTTKDIYEHEARGILRAANDHKGVTDESLLSLLASLCWRSL